MNLQIDWVLISGRAASLKVSSIYDQAERRCNTLARVLKHFIIDTYCVTIISDTLMVLIMGKWLGKVKIGAHSYVHKAKCVAFYFHFLEFKSIFSIQLFTVCHGINRLRETSVSVFHLI